MDFTPMTKQIDPNKIFEFIFLFLLNIIFTYMIITAWKISIFAFTTTSLFAATINLALLDTLKKTRHKRHRNKLFISAVLIGLFFSTCEFFKNWQ